MEEDAQRNAYARIDRNPCRAVLLRFGASLFSASVVGAAGLALGLAEQAAALWLLVLGCAALVPGLGRVVYVAWLGLGVTLGLLTSPVLLGLLYFAVIAPCALVMRLSGRDALRRRIDRAAPTYWQAYEDHEDRARYFRQF